MSTGVTLTKVYLQFKAGNLGIKFKPFSKVDLVLIFLSIFFSMQVITKQKARFYKFLNRIRYEKFWKLKDDEVC